MKTKFRMRTRNERALRLLSWTISLLMICTFVGSAFGAQRQDRLNHLLVEAIWEGNSVAACRALDGGANSNAFNSLDEKPRSVWRICRDIFGGNKQKNRSPEIAIQMSIRVGNPMVVRLLLDSGARTDVKDVYGQTLLQQAQILSAWNGHQMCYYGYLIDKKRGTNHKAVLALLESRGLKRQGEPSLTLYMQNAFR